MREMNCELEPELSRELEEDGTVELPPEDKWLISETVS